MSSGPISLEAVSSEAVSPAGSGVPNLLAAAITYVERDRLSAIPFKRGTKKPAVDSWGPYQARRPTLEELEGWFGGREDNDPGIVTGAISNLVVLDIDPRHGGDESAQTLSLPPTFTVRTPSGGRHCYYRHPGGRLLGE